MSAHKLALLNLVNARRGIILIVVATLAFASAGSALADPVPPESNLQVFCFRITDIERVAGDPGNDRFRFEFEALNWTNDAASGIYIALTQGTGVGTVSGSAPFFAGAAIDQDGRPLVLKDVNSDGSINAADLEDANGNGRLDPGEDKNGNGRLDNDPIPGNLNPPNDWTVTSSSSTAITWSAGTPVPGVDLLDWDFSGSGPLQPGDPEIAFMLFTNLADPSTVIIETIDNGPNVQDGFVIEVDDLDPGETISFNWFLTDATGNIIGDFGGELGTNPYAFGVVNLTSLAGNVVPTPVFAGNTGFSQSPLIFFDSVYNVPNPANFAAEFGASMTAAFQNPADNLFNIPVTTQLLNTLVIDFDRDPLGNPLPDRTLIGEQYAAWGVHFDPAAFYTGSRLTCYQGYSSGTSPNYLVTFVAADADPANCQMPIGGPNSVLNIRLDFPVNSASIEGYTDITAVDSDALLMQAFDVAGNLLDGDTATCSNTPNPNPPPGFTEGTCTPSVSAPDIRVLKVFPQPGLIDALDNLTLTKQDVPPELIVIKHVINDNGGTATAADFTMTVTGNNPSPASFPGDETGTSVALDAGAYSVSESGPPGYAANFDGCSGSIMLNQTIICTVTNDDIQPRLIVIKHVVNDNGGTATASDFTMSVTGANVNPASFPGEEPPGTMVALDAGNYDVTESGPNGYTVSFSADCAGTIAVGETKTCTVTNNDNAPSLTLEKIVVNDNGGTATPADWTLTATGPTGFSGPGPSVSSDPSFDAGTYALSESGPSGYTASTWVCVGGTQSGDDITLALGESATCTITNDDIESPPDLVIIKSDGQDTARAGETLTYTLTISNAGAQTATGVMVTDTLPARTTFVAASDGGSTAGSLVTWPAFDLAAGASVTRTVTVQVNDNLMPAPVRDTRTWRRSGLSITFSTPDHYSGCGSAVTITNIAAVADDGAHGPDPTPENNTASDTDGVAASDVIWTTGIPENWSLRGWVRVEYITDRGRILIKEYRVRQTGNLRLTISYPPVSEWPVMRSGIAEIHVDLSIRLFDNNGRPVRWVGGDQRRAPGVLGPGQDWDVWCRVANRRN